MKGKGVRTGTPEQEKLFAQLWEDYWFLRAVSGGKPRGSGRKWRQGMALFASSHEAYKMGLSRAQIEIWAK